VCRRLHRKVLVFSTGACTVDAEVLYPLTRKKTALGRLKRAHRRVDGARSLIGLWKAFAGVGRRGIN
jgi:hypothetical protein